jgi:hypothetical protein
MVEEKDAGGVASDGLLVEMQIRSTDEEFQIATAIGRMGKRLMLRYHTESGELRERLFKPTHFNLKGVSDAAIVRLPLYKKRRCPPRIFDPSVVGTTTKGQDRFPKEILTCPRCGLSVGEAGHGYPKLAVEEFRLDTGETFNRDAYNAEIARRVEEKFPEINLALHARWRTLRRNLQARRS